MPDGNQNNLGKREQLIRALCSEVIASKDEKRLRKLCAELRKTIREHVEAVRINALELKLKELSASKKLRELSTKK